MGFEHDYKNYPELTNTNLQVLGLTSPHKQITEDFTAEVVKVHDGDTVTLRTDFRDFDFPLRILYINAPELSEDGGKESQAWLEGLVLHKKVQVIIDIRNRVGKYGRLLGDLMINGVLYSEIAIMLGYATPFTQRNEGKILSFARYISEFDIDGRI